MSGSQNVLDYGLRQVPRADAQTKEFKSEIINALWPPADAGRIITPNNLENRPELEPFFNHYIRQTSSITSTKLKLEAVTHRRLLQIAKLMHDETKTRAQIRESSVAAVPPNAAALDEDQAEALIELAARILLLVYVDNTLHASRVRSITWAENATIKDFIDAAIPLNKITGPEGRKRIPVRLNARNLDLIAGIQISWTWYLHEHLQMDEDDRKIKIFHLASILRQVQESTSNVLPKDLAQETLDTLSLLLPSDNQDTEDWFFREQTRLQMADESLTSESLSTWTTYVRLSLRSLALRRIVTLPQLNRTSLRLDSSAARCSRLPDFARRINHYAYWGERLEYLVQVYYDHEPRGLKQWARDDRRPAQRTNFWITVGAFVLALVSLALTATQTWASVQQLSKAFSVIPPIQVGRHRTSQYLLANV
jgi:hypothetical protein